MPSLLEVENHLNFRCVVVSGIRLKNLFFQSDAGDPRDHYFSSPETEPNTVKPAELNAWISKTSVWVERFPLGNRLTWSNRENYIASSYGHFLGCAEHLSTLYVERIVAQDWRAA